MAIDRFKLGWSTGGKLVLGTNPYIPNVSWSEGLGTTTLDVLMTAGEVSTARTPILQTMASIREIDDSGSVVKVLMADGVEAINGSISFDCNRTYMQSFLEWVFESRKESFTAYIGTEDFQYLKLPSCMWSSIAITASEGSLLSCSISFMSNQKASKVSPSFQHFTEIYKSSNLIPYWQTGALLDNDILRVSSWTLTVNQNLTPQYMNTKNFDLPAYFRAANWEFQLSVQTLVDTQEYNKIQIGVLDTLNPIIMSIDNSVEMSSTASFGGLDSMGNYQLSVELIGVPTKHYPVSSYLDSASYQKPFSITFI